MNKRWKKAVSVMLCAAMILSVNSVTISADGETNPPATEQTQQETETQKPENGETDETGKPENGETDETKPENGGNTEENGTGNENGTPDNGNNGDGTDENADTEKPMMPIEPPVTEEKPGESLPMENLVPATPAEKTEVQENADDKIDTEDELKSALEGDKTEIVISGEITLNSPLAINRSVTIKGENGASLKEGDSVSGNFITISSDNVTLKDLTVTGNGKGNYAIHFYNVTGGTLDNVNVSGAKGCSVLVNGSDVSVNGGKFADGDWNCGGIEYGIGEGVKNLPKLTVTGTSVTVHIDKTTVERAKKLNNDNVADTAKAINEAVSVEGFELVLNADGSIASTDGTVPDTAKGEATLNGVVYDTLEEAIAAAQNGDTITLNKDVSCGAITVPAGVTLEGNGKTLTCDTEIQNGAFVTAGGDNVTLRNMTVDANSKAKHGVQFYCSKGGKMENVTVKGGKYTAVIVNGSEVSISGGTLSSNGYAVIEYAMGKNVQDIPKLSVSGVTNGSSDKPFVYMDNATINAMKESDTSLKDKTTQEIVDKLFENGSLSGVSSVTVPGEGAIIPSKPNPDPDPKPDPKPEKPSKPSKPSNGGSSNGASSNSGTTVDKEEEDYNEFWDKVIDRINKADEGDTITVHAGNYDKMPNKVMKALEKNGVGLIIKYNGGEIEIPAGEAVNKSNKLFWSFKELGNYVFATEDNNEQDNDKQDNEQTDGSDNNTQTEQKPSGTVETKPNPQTGSEDYVGLAAALAVTAGVAAITLGKKKKD